MVLTFCGTVNIAARARIRSTSLFTTWNCQRDLCHVISLLHDSSGTISMDWLLCLFDQRSTAHQLMMMMMIRPSHAKMTTTSWITGTCGCEDDLSVRSSHESVLCSVGMDVPVESQAERLCLLCSCDVGVSAWSPPHVSPWSRTLQWRQRRARLSGLEPLFPRCQGWCHSN